MHNHEIEEWIARLAKLIDRLEAEIQSMGARIHAIETPEDAQRVGIGYPGPEIIAERRAAYGGCPQGAQAQEGQGEESEEQPAGAI